MKMGVLRSSRKLLLLLVIIVTVGSFLVYQRLRYTEAIRNVFHNDQLPVETRVPVIVESTEPATYDISKWAGNRTQTGKSHILINAYMRGGSTFASGLVHNRPDVFYFYEPLWQFSMMGYFRERNQHCGITTNRCREMNETAMNERLFDKKMKTYRLPNESPAEMLYRALDSMYNCRMNTPGFEFVIAPSISDAYGASSWTAYKSCAAKVGRERRAECLNELDKVCKTRQVRSTKVLRLCLDTLAPMMEIDPLLKVVHVFRDPRGTLNSRITKTGWYPLKSSNQTAIKLDASAMCDKMLRDYKAGKQLLARYPDRFMFARYEDLNWSYKPFVTQQIQTFLGFAQKQSQTDMSSMLNSSQVQKFTPTTGFSWRQSLSASSNALIDLACEEVYNALGYITITGESNKKNTSIPSFRTMDVFDINKI